MEAKLLIESYIKKKKLLIRLAEMCKAVKK